MTGNVTGNIDGIVGGTTPAAGSFNTVGIGGTAVDSLLLVQGGTFPQSRINNTSSGGESGIRFRSYNSTLDDTHVDTYVENINDGTDENGKFHIRTHSGSALDRLTIVTASGNVGIGDVDPGSKLTVNGDIETSTTGKIKQKGAFMQSSTHQALTLGY